MASSADIKYMQQHDIPAAMEQLLAETVKSKSERPHEVINWTPVVQAAKSPKLDTAKGCDASAAELASLDFDIFSYDQTSPQILLIVLDIFKAHDILSTFSITEDTFLQWAATVQANYHPANPFHNFRHAVNVLQTLHVYLMTYEAKAYFPPNEIFAMLVAAVCHDLQHPGVNNIFLSQIMHPLAQRYCDHAVLEQHHCATALAIISLPSHDICASLKGASNSYGDNEKYREFRSDVIACIMGTEVAAHKKHINSLKTVIEAGFNKEVKDHRSALMVALVEAADISNEVRSFAFSRQWAPLVCEEFFLQGDQQRKLGIPVKPMNDRGIAVMSKEQEGFIKFLCTPLFEELSNLIQGFTFCVHNLSTNTSTWQSMNSDS